MLTTIFNAGGISSTQNTSTGMKLGENLGGVDTSTKNALRKANVLGNKTSASAILHAAKEQAKVERQAKLVAEMAKTKQKLAKSANNLLKTRVDHAKAMQAQELEYQKLMQQHGTNMLDSRFKQQMQAAAYEGNLQGFTGGSFDGL